MKNGLSLRRFAVLLALGVLGVAGPLPSAQAQDHKVPIHFDGGFTLVPGDPVDDYIPIHITVFGESSIGGLFVGTGEGKLSTDFSHGSGQVTFYYDEGNTLTVFYKSRLIDDPDYPGLKYSCSWIILDGTGPWFDRARGGGPNLGDLVILHDPADVFQGVFTADGTIFLTPPK